MSKLGMMHCLVLACAVTLFTSAAWTELDPPYPEPAQLWFTLMPQSPIQDFSQYEHAVRTFIPEAIVGQPVEPSTLEVTRESDHQTVASIPYTPIGSTTYPIGCSSSPFRFYKIPPALKALPDGSYSVAILVGGRRCSNAAKFVLERAADLNTLPVLELVPLDPPPFYRLPMLGVRVNGSKTFAGESLKYSDVAYAALIVDGVERRPQWLVWAGPDPLLKTGARWEIILDISGNYSPPIDPGKPHRVELRVDHYAANPVDIPAHP